MKGLNITLVMIAAAAFSLLPLSVRASTDGASTNLGYRLGPEDVLQISVWKDESLTREVLVRPDGMISFPLVGEVQAEGKTAEELQKDIRERLAPFIPDPTVTVAVTKVNSYKIYVVGKVNRPGEYLVGHYSNVMQALSLAGGMTPYASENGVKVLRWEQGNQRTYSFRYGDVKKGNHLEQNILLQRGDVIVVP
jgi:polysaccharide export outer membrane protein